MSQNIHPIHAHDARAAAGRWVWGLVLTVGVFGGPLAADAVLSPQERAITSAETARPAEASVRMTGDASSVTRPSESAQPETDSGEEDC